METTRDWVERITAQVLRKRLEGGPLSPREEEEDLFVTALQKLWNFYKSEGIV